MNVMGIKPKRSTWELDNGQKLGRIGAKKRLPIIIRSFQDRQIGHYVLFYRFCLIDQLYPSLPIMGKL